MKKTVLVILFAGLLAFGNVGVAETYKIGVVNPNKLVEQSPQYDQVRKELETEFKRRNQDLIAKQKQLKTLEEKLARDATVMTEDESKRLEQDIRSRRRNLNHTRDEYREDLNLRRNEELNKLLKKVSELVHRVAEEENYDVVISQGVAFASKRVDLTNLVLQRLNEEYKASAGN